MSSVEESYPEHEKLMAIADKSRAIGQFIDWCQDEKELVLVNIDYDNVDGGITYSSRPPIRDLLAEYFEIDQQKIEAEKRAMLEALRSMS